MEVIGIGIGILEMIGIKIGIGIRIWNCSRRHQTPHHTGEGECWGGGV